MIYPITTEDGQMAAQFGILRDDLIFASQPPSNITLVQSAACNNGASGNYNCTLSATGTGNLILIQQADYAANPAAPSLPTDGGDTFVQDCTLTVSGNGRLTYFSFPNSVSGRTTFTIQPASGASSAVVSEWSGAATASPFDACVSNLVANSASSRWNSDALLAAQTDLAIGAVYNRTSGTDTYSPTDVWTTLKASGNTADGDQLYTEYIVNGLKSYFTASGTINNARNQWAAVALYKSAVAGTDPGGSQPHTYMDFNAGTNGNTITLTDLANSVRGIQNNMTGSTSPLTGMTYSTSCAHNPLTKVTVNGTSYVSEALGLAYDLSQANKNFNMGLNTNNVGGSFSVGYWFKMPDPSDTVNPYTWNGIVDSTDRAELAVQNNSWTLETATGDSGAVGSTSYNTWYWVTILYVNGGTSKMRLYDESGNQVGSEVTHATNQAGVSNATGIAIGRLGAESGNPSITVCTSGIQYNLSGTFPLLP